MDSVDSQRTSTVRVAAVDDHPAILHGLRSIAAQSGDRFELVGWAASVPELLQDDCSAEVVLLDVRLVDGSRPADNVAALIEAGFRVLMYTDGARAASMAEAVQAGALGIVLKGDPPEHLVDAIDEVRSGQTVMSAELAELLHSSSALRATLSAREIEVLRLFNQGLLTKQVARLLGVAEATIKQHIRNVRAKYTELGRPSGTRVALLQRAEEDGYLTD